MSAGPVRSTPSPPHAVVAGQDLDTAVERGRRILRDQFGHADYRPGQEEAVRRILGGADMTIVMPTGAGKSACFQLPALIRDGLTLVVSPLIALMKDQVEGLRARGIPADFVSSAVDLVEQRARLDRAVRGETRLLYVAPERLVAPAFVRAMQQSRIHLVAVDEAHCISQWGHDFRPAYFGIPAFIARLEGLPERARPQVVALTGTATQRVRSDIAQHLGIPQDQLFLTGFRRPNLRFVARRCDRRSDRVEQVRQVIDGVSGAGIVYCATRKDADEVALALQAGGLDAAAYHAGLDDALREDVQDGFGSGRIRVIVATNAFGMGIDKPDIRFVVHHALPGSVEAYYQEAGRAGRDGAPSYCVLVHGAADRYLHEFFLDGSSPSDDAVMRTWGALSTQRGDGFEGGVAALAGAAGVPEIQARGALRLLEEAGLVERLDDRDNAARLRFVRPPAEVVASHPEGTAPRGLLEWAMARRAEAGGDAVAVRPSMAAAELGLGREAFLRALRDLGAGGGVEVRMPLRGQGIVASERDLGPRDASERLRPHLLASAARRARGMERLDAIQRFAWTRSCRHAFLLGYFGEECERRCRACDNCRGWDQRAAPSEAGSRAARSPRSRERGSSSAPTRRAMSAIEAGEARDAVLRAVADVDGRYGLTVVRLVLRGSRSKRIVEAGLERSEAYGLLARLPVEAVDQVIREVQAEALIETTGGAYPVVALTEDGRLRMGHVG